MPIFLACVAGLPRDGAGDGRLRLLRNVGEPGRWVVQTLAIVAALDLPQTGPT